MKKAFPIHGIFGIVILLLSEVLHFKKVDPFYSWFYCFAWWSYILIMDAIIYRLKGNSLLLNRTGEFFLMIPWSIFVWLIFEAANLFLKNWYYINLPHCGLERWVGYAIAYGTVLPGIFETTEFLETTGLFKNLKIKKMMISSVWQFFLVLLGTFCLVVSILIPEYFFSLIWIGFILFLEPFIYQFGGKSLLKDLEEGNLKKIFFLLLAGLICGILWEFWNFWALSKWVYTVPFFEEGKGFEMPVPGFLGFPPFAIEAYVMYNFISLFRYGRGWEESTYRLHPDKKTRPLTSILTAILMVSFYILIFKAIDTQTVDSYFPRLRDAYWIDLQHRMELPKVGVNTIEDLLLKTGEKKDKEELALRLLIPKEILAHWVEKAQLVQLKGLGVKNLKLLERVGIHSISALASEDPEQLYIKIRESARDEVPPRRAKIRIWVKEAQKQMRHEG